MDIDSEYVVLQAEYRNLNEDKDNIFPNCWYNVKEYELKKKILKECIKNNLLIRDCILYNEFRDIALK